MRIQNVPRQNVLRHNVPTKMSPHQNVPASKCPRIKMSLQKCPQKCPSGNVPQHYITIAKESPQKGKYHMVKELNLMSLSSTISNLAELSKARLSALVVSTTAFGFLSVGPTALAYTSIPTFAAASLGTALCASSAATFNQVIEVERDRKMKRTYWKLYLLDFQKCVSRVKTSGRT